eukprot:CAMPEP_0172569954 /NCGR_PEP_ID=MMETSP1067-20121228/125630_1 /TAXON_ID=265564 ORGANISM="Thalassiosira punctigera, Strain Tpunct2005C2" /NCGR_SAMPLE_ID=MMETSP1067 /ASSEMBLY_ACC=CAM_ASM_000444 /LENGTH=70 /DNA_ID=CAMNT_0013361917 /DNA_START=353 /DNA_END=562 /DNA_ORIENTATION=+
MKLLTLFLLPLAATTAFAPEASITAAIVRQHPRGGDFAIKNGFDDAAEKITSTTEEYVEKADDLVLRRVV